VATNYANNYITNYNKPPEIGVTAISGATGSGNTIINTSSGHGFVVDWSKVGTRVVGALQMVGGAVETIFGGVGGVVSAETGVGAVLGYAVAMNGIDNATAGAIQLWTGESQNTLLHKGVSATAVYAGASYDTAERVATYADISTIALGGFASYKGFTSEAGMTFKNYKIAKGGTETLDYIETTNKAGVAVKQRISTEFSHTFISRSAQRQYGLPNWLVNNPVNVHKLNTVQHSLIDSYRFNFLRAGFKNQVGWFGEYNWFTKFPQ
jgi:hypothetical protein